MAGAVAVGVVGAGITLAKVEIGRRASRTRRREQARFGLLAHERPVDGMRRMALAQLDLAIELLDADGSGAPRARTVHETRKALKRLRALVRLLRPELGEHAYARESATLRDVGRRLAGARDAEVLVDTLDALTKRSGRPARRGVKRLRRELSSERDRAARGDLAAQAARSEALAELRALRASVAGWRLSDLPGVELVEPGMRRVYEQGRRRMRRATRAKESRAGRALHEWRKRVKDLRYAAEMLEREGSDRDRAIGRVARRADHLGETLGEEHDLAVLAERVRTADSAFRGRKGDRKALLKAIGRRRAKLRKRALREGGRLYARKSKRFVRGLRRAYARAAK